MPAGDSAFREHFILNLTTAQLRATPVDEMVARYGKTRGGGTCERDFGNGLIDYWRGERRTYCAAKESAASSSSIECFLAKQTAHKGSGDNLCVGKNVAINFRDLSDGKTPQAYFERYVATRHVQEHSKIKYSRGTLTAACDPVPALWQAKHFPGWNVNWFNAFQSVDELACDVRETQPTLIVERDTFANFFHNSEDFVNTLLALAVLRWSNADLQILITDLYPKGPFWPMWSKVFKGNREPLSAWEIAQKYGNKNVCFDNAAIAILGAAAPITVASWNTPCSSSAVVRAYSDYVIHGLGLAGQSRYVQLRDPKRVVVTYLARRSATEWPEKRFCDSEHSFFLCERMAHLSIRKLGRSIKNDGAVVAALRSLTDAQFGNGAVVEVRDVDYSTLTLEEQIEIDLDTDVMVGPHGAGLLHNIFMPDRAVLIELSIDGSSANRHFHNLARWQGRKYVSKSMANPVPPDQLASLVKSTIAGLDLSKPY